MTRTEMLAAGRHVSRLLRIASFLNQTSFAAMAVGVPLTLAAFSGLSVWPGVICWVSSWGAYTYSSHVLAKAEEINAAVRASRSGTEPDQ